MMFDESVLNASSTKHFAWVVSDQSGVRQDILQTFGMHPVTAIFHDLHSKGRYMQLSDTSAISPLFPPKGGGYLILPAMWANGKDPHSRALG